MSIGRFTDQNELDNVFKHYCLAYQKDKGRDDLYRDYNNIKILHSTDTHSAVYFNAELVLRDNPADELFLETNAVIAKEISTRLIDMLAFYLAQGIEPDNVPENARICFAVNHGAHWTAIDAQIPTFKRFYSELHDQLKNSLGNLRVPENLRHNDCKNLIYNYLGVDLKLPTYQQAMKVLNNDNLDGIIIDHYDSMNSDAYSSRIDRSLSLIRLETKLAKPIHLYCSQQKGNTCGDHTVLNAFVAAVYNGQAEVNQGETSSVNLRELTNLIQSNELSEAEKVDLTQALLATVKLTFSQLENSVKLSESTSPEKAVVDEFEKSVREYIKEHLPEDVAVFGQLMESVSPEEFAKNELSLSQSRPKGLDESIKVARYVYDKINEKVPDSEDKVAYQALASIVALDELAIKEHNALRAGMSAAQLTKQYLGFKKFEDEKKTSKQDVLNPESQESVEKSVALESKKFKDVNMVDFIKGVMAKIQSDCHVHPRFTFFFIEPKEKKFDLKDRFKKMNSAAGAYTEVLDNMRGDVGKVWEAQRALAQANLQGARYENLSASLKFHVSINDFGNMDIETIHRLIAFLENESLDSTDLPFKFKIITPQMSDDARFKDNDQITLYFDKYASTASFVELAGKIEKFLKEEGIADNAKQRGLKDKFGFNSFVSARFDSNKIHQQYGEFAFFDAELGRFFEQYKGDIGKLKEVPLCGFEMVFNNILFDKNFLIPQKNTDISPEHSAIIQAEFNKMVSNPKDYLQYDPRLEHAKKYINYMYDMLNEERNKNIFFQLFRNFHGTKDHKWRAFGKLKALADSGANFESMQAEVQKILGSGEEKPPAYRSENKDEDIDPTKVLYSYLSARTKDFFEGMRDNDMQKLSQLADNIPLDSRRKLEL